MAAFAALRSASRDPPVGFPVQFRVIGPDPDTVRDIAYRVRDIAGESALVNLVRDTQLNWNERVRMLRVRIDQDKARLLGLSTADVSGGLRTVLSGAPVTQIRRGDELIDVVVRADAGERKSLENLGDINLFSRTGFVALPGVIALGGMIMRNSVILVEQDVGSGIQPWQAIVDATVCRTRPVVLTRSIFWGPMAI